MNNISFALNNWNYLFKKMMKKFRHVSLCVFISTFMNLHSASASDDACVSSFFVSVESTIANSIPITEGRCDDYCIKTFVDGTNYVSILYKKGKMNHIFVEPVDGALKKVANAGLTERELLSRANEFLMCKYGEIENLNFEFVKKDGTILKYGVGGDVSKETCNMRVFGAVMMDQELGHIVAILRAVFRGDFCFDAVVRP